MPYRIEKRGDEWCVVGPSRTHGCHPSRAKAIKQQRALYYHENKTASVYEELDAAEVLEEVVELSKEQGADLQRASELVKIEVGASDTSALTASLVQQMEQMAERQAATHEALVAALDVIAARDPVINVEAPNVTVESSVIPAPEVTVEATQVTVEPTRVEVHPEIVLPASKRKVVLERDPRNFHRVTGATIEDEEM